MNEFSIPVKLNITLDTNNLEQNVQQIVNDISENVTKILNKNTEQSSEQKISTDTKYSISFDSITKVTNVLINSIDALTASIKNLSTTLPSFGSSFSSRFDLTRTFESLINPIALPVSKTLSSLFNKPFTLGKKSNSSDDKVYEFDREQTFENFASNLYDSLKSIFTSLSNSIISLFSSFLSNMEKSISNMANSYYLTNSTTRYNAFTYGMSSSESYGFEVAKSILGISSNEDILYMSSDQLSMFKEIMNTITAYYDEITESGLFEDYYEMQVQYTLLSYELSLEIYSFLAEYSDSIVELVTSLLELAESALPALVDFLSILTPVIDAIVSFISWLTCTVNDATTSSDISSIISSYQSSSTTVNITSTNNFSGSTDDEIEDYEDATEAMIEAAKLAFSS